MSTRTFLSAALVMGLAACGGSVTDSSQAPGNTSPSGSPGTGAPHSGAASSSPSCGDTELPACAKSEVRFTSQADCAKSYAQCRQQPGCDGTSATAIWCGKDSICGDAPPQCGPGTVRYESCDGISPPLTCSPVTQCGFTIYCGPVHSVPAQIWPNDATQLVASDDGGGLAPAGPAGSTCSMGQAEYTFDRASRALSWRTCESETSLPWKMKSGQRTLTATEASNIETNMKGVSWSSSTSCGADKSVEKIRVTSPNGTLEYLDSFYACEKKGTYVDGLDAVFSALRALVP